MTSDNGHPGGLSSQATEPDVSALRASIPDAWSVGKVYEILRETTGQFRKGNIFEGSPELVAQAEAGIGDEGLRGGGVLEVYAMPHESEADGLEKVDMHFVTVAVNKAKAEARRAELIGLLNAYPAPDRLAGGPSYIEVGGELGDQGAAFELFALGKVLGFWDVITPETFGAIGDQARQLAGSGFIMCTGYTPAKAIEARSGETERLDPKDESAAICQRTPTMPDLTTPALDRLYVLLSLVGAWLI